MSSGIRATVEFSAPDLCPVVAASAAAGATIDSVAANVCSPDTPESVTEFSVQSDSDVGDDLETDVTEVFAAGSTTRYRFAHGDGIGCPCECLGQFGCPVARYVAREGRLTLVFHATDYEELRDVVAELRDRFPSLDVKRFVRSSADGSPTSRDPVLVDRSKLTARQLEVLETAFEMGYFERPRRANATEVAAALDIDPSTFREHLDTAQAKVLADFL